jgi:hypothetical protein
MLSSIVDGVPSPAFDGIKEVIMDMKKILQLWVLIIYSRAV